MSKEAGKVELIGEEKDHTWSSCFTTDDIWEKITDQPLLETLLRMKDSAKNGIRERTYVNATVNIRDFYDVKAPDDTSVLTNVIGEFQCPQSAFFEDLMGIEDFNHLIEILEKMDS